jgi:TIR domain-containing protein/SIR2-like protein
MNERSWERLLRSIDDGLVVPVLGPQVLTGEDGDALQKKIARQLLSFYDEPDDSPLTPFYELSEVVTRLKNKHNLQDLYADIHDAIEQLISAKDSNIPEPIRKIAAITSFRLFVTLTPDDLLARCLRTRCAANEIIYSPYLPTSEGSDLPKDWQSRQGEVQLLYLFGKSRPAPMFAIHDEDFLEYVHNIIARGSHVPLKFLDELQQRSLLLIGCSFPEWLSRFFLRFTNQSRLSESHRKREWLIDAQSIDKDLVYFLESFSGGTEILSDISPSTFIAELHQRWLVRHGSPEQIPSSNHHHVPRGVMFFISYCRATDLPAAEKLFESLKSQGVSSTEIWFDRTAIEPGQDFHERILEGIRSCRYFIPVISQSADNLDEKYFRREWNEAIDRGKSIQGRMFVVPIIVDQAYEPQGYQRVPRVWADNLDFGFAPIGLPDERTNFLFRKLIRAERQQSA